MRICFQKYKAPVSGIYPFFVAEVTDIAPLNTYS